MAKMAIIQVWRSKGMDEFSARFEAVRKQFDEMIKTHGWASHYVPLDMDHINYHTHGLEMNYKHLDFQITFPMPMKVAHAITDSLVDAVKQGKVFEDGQEYTGYLRDGYKLGIKKFKENDRDVLRLIFPDDKNVLPTEKGCKRLYRHQLDVLPD